MPALEAKTDSRKFGQRERCQHCCYNKKGFVFFSCNIEFLSNFYLEVNKPKEASKSKIASQKEVAGSSKEESADNSNKDEVARTSSKEDSADSSNNKEECVS